MPPNPQTVSTLRRFEYNVKLGLILAWGLLVTALFTPIAVILWGNTSVSWAYARVLSWGGLIILGIKLDIEGRENLRTKPAIYMGNHQSNFDIILHGRVYPRNTVVIGKKELRRVPVFGLFFAATGNIMIDRADKTKAVAGLDQAVEALRDRLDNIWIFPEGTRSKGHGLGKFKKGGVHMAVAAQAPVVGVVLEPITAVLDPVRKYAPGGRIRMRVLPPVTTTGKTGAEVEALTSGIEERFRETLREFGHPDA